jgi:hypothetical protein
VVGCVNPIWFTAEEAETAPLFLKDIIIHVVDRFYLSAQRLSSHRSAQESSKVQEFSMGHFH